MGIYSAAKDAANVLKEAGKINEYQKILDLIDDLFSKREEIEKLKAKISKLQSQIKISNEYVFENNCYWHKESHDGPYCSRCFDKNKDLIRIIPNNIGSNRASCPECKTYVNFTGKNDSNIIRNESKNYNLY